MNQLVFEEFDKKLPQENFCEIISKKGHGVSEEKNVQVFYIVINENSWVRF